jgi:hypothetical protein
LLWLDENTLVIGWADRFKICKVVRRHYGTLGMVESASGGSGIGGIGGTGAGVKKTSKVLGATLGALGATSLGSNFVTTSSSDKKDLGTHVEISNQFFYTVLLWKLKFFDFY